MIINHNIAAMSVQRYMNINDASQVKDMERLSSGMRINRGADDAAGLAVSEKFRSQIRGLQQASRNAQDGISFIQTAEGYLAETTDVLQRMRELAVQAANGIYTDKDRQQIMVEINELVDEVDRIASVAEFNALPLLRGAFAKADPQSAVSASFPTDLNIEDGGGVTVHIGANMDQRRKVYIENMGAAALGLSENGNTTQRDLKVSVSTVETANRMIATMDHALYRVAKQRADLGAYQNRLDHAIRGVNVAAENLQSAESIVRDTDMAKEMVNLVKDQILNQSSAVMLAHANSKNQSILRVLG